jgi:hypothetical protein
MRIPPELLLSLIPTLIVALSGRAAAAPSGSQPRVAVLNTVDLPPALADVRAKLGAELAVAVTQRAYDLVPAPPSTCVDHDCLKSLAATSGATDILVVSGTRNQLLGYTIDLRLWNADSDREDHSSPECNACSASQMVDNVVRSVGPLLDRLPALHVTQAAIRNPVPPAPPIVGASPPGTVPAAKASPARVAIGLGLIGAGAASAAFGISFLAVNGDSACGGGTQVCERVYQTSTSGTLLTAAGGLAIAAGAVVLLFFRAPSSTSVAIGPSGISLAGTY